MRESRPQTRENVADVAETEGYAIYSTNGKFHTDDSSISETDIARYRAGLRTNEPIAFSFESPHEAENMHDDRQVVDRELLLQASPVIRKTLENSQAMKQVRVREGISAKTVNCFLQLIAPSPRKTLPTYYLWKATSEPRDADDDIASIQGEKIRWDLDALAELYAFARELEVLWICDMVIDSLHWMFKEHAQHETVPGEAEDAHAVYPGLKVPSIDDLQNRPDVSGFKRKHLDAFMTSGLDPIVICFLAEQLNWESASHSGAEFLSGAPQAVVDIFERGVPWRNDGLLATLTAEEFCDAYHHHKGGDPCYRDFEGDEVV